ncbi:hypothetical protein [Edaphobacter bradus]|nr:hypothetical protein [Edaphobacter bradus]
MLELFHEFIDLLCDAFPRLGFIAQCMRKKQIKRTTPLSDVDIDEKG